MLFRNRVLAVVRNIPKGSVRSYGEVAALAGNPGAARAVGAIMSRNRDPEIPCHRVIQSDGTLGGYRNGVAQKHVLLKKEGAI